MAGSDVMALVDFKVTVVEFLHASTCFDYQHSHTFRLKSDALNGPFGTLSSYSQTLQDSSVSWSYTFRSGKA